MFLIIIINVIQALKPYKAKMYNNLIPTNSFVQVMKVAFQNPLVVPSKMQPAPGVQIVNSDGTIGRVKLHCKLIIALTASEEGTFQAEEYAQFLEAKTSQHPL